jgi:hypothetical protein
MIAYPSELNFDPQFNYGPVLNSDSFQIPVDKRNPFPLPVRIWVGKAGRSMVGKNIETGKLERKPGNADGPTCSPLFSSAARPLPV